VPFGVGGRFLVSRLPQTLFSEFHANHADFADRSPPSWSRMESEGVSGIFQDISGYISLFQLFFASTEQQRRSAVGWITGSHEILRGKVACATSGRPKGFSRALRPRVSRIFTALSGYIRVFLLIFFCSECHLFRSLFCLSSLRKKITLSSLNCLG
jgi:hypothetical protein